MKQPGDPRPWHLSGEQLPDELRHALGVARADLPPPHVWRGMVARAAPILLASSKAAASAAATVVPQATLHATAHSALAVVLTKAVAVGALAGVVVVGGTAAIQEAVWRPASPSQTAMVAPSKRDGSTAAHKTGRATRTEVSDELSTSETTPGAAPTDDAVTGAPMAGAPIAGAPMAGAPMAGAPMPSAIRGAVIAGALKPETFSGAREAGTASGPATAKSTGPLVSQPTDRTTWTDRARIQPEAQALAPATAPTSSLTLRASAAAGAEPKVREPSPENAGLGEPANGYVAPRTTTSAPTIPRMLSIPSRAEARVLEGARAALESHPSDALALADQHRVEYPHGALSQERELIAIDALSRLGRVQEARARASRFRAEFPASVHVRRIESIVGNF